MIDLGHSRRLESGETIKLVYSGTWQEEAKGNEPDPSSEVPYAPPESPTSGSRLSRLSRVPLLRTHSLSLNFLRGSNDKKMSPPKNSARGKESNRGDLTRQASDLHIGLDGENPRPRLNFFGKDEESFSEVWRSEKERAQKEKRTAERKQWKKQKEKEWAAKETEEGHAGSAPAQRGAMSDT